MNPSRAHARPLARALGAAGLLVAVLLAAAPAQAATGYTWTGGYDVPGADHHSWGDPLNWTPQGVPTDGDAVVVAGVPGHVSTSVDGIPAVALSSLTIAGTEEHSVHFGAEGESVTTSGFTWSGGEILTDLTLGADADGTVVPGGPKALSADLVDRGRLTLDGIGVGGLSLQWEHAITVVPGGALVSTGVSGITHDSCCGDNPNRLIGQGTVEVSDGTFTIDGVELDLTGTMRIAEGAEAVTTLGPSRLGPGATYTGGGTLRIEHTGSPYPNPEHPEVSQGAALVSGTNTLADGFRLVAGDDAQVTGVGTITGTGTLGLEDATIYGDLTVGAGVDLAVNGDHTSGVDVWDPDEEGYHGRLSLAGTATVGSGAVLQLSSGTQTVLERGAHLTVGSGGTIGSRSCCTDVPELVGRSGSTVELGAGTGRATLSWITVGSAGTVVVPAAADVLLDKVTFDQRGGTTTLGARSTTTTRDTDFVLRKGTLRGAGHLAGEVVNTGGVVRPGTTRAPSTLTLDGYRQGRLGTLALDVSGRKADRLVVRGAAELAGRLQVSGRAGHGQRAVVLSARQETGRFTRVTAKAWRVVYTHRTVAVVGR